MTEIPHRVGAPARRAFEAAGYTTLEELLAADEGDLLILHGVGPKRFASCAKRPTDTRDFARSGPHRKSPTHPNTSQ
jgi:hypothetical protein